MTEATAAPAADKPETTPAPAPNAGVSDSRGAKPSGTVIDNALAEADKQVSSPATWPENWREEMTGGDEEELKRAKRYASPAGIWKKARALEQKLSSGEYKQVVPFPKDGTPEQQAEWRTTQGIPEAPDKYDTTIGDGIVWGEADKPLLENYTKYAHENHLAPDQVKANLRWYHQMQQTMTDAREQQDAGHRAQSEDALRAEWGAEYRVNMNVVSNYLKTLPTTLNEMLMDARTSDGRRLINDAEMLKHLASTARELNPAAALLPASGADSKGVEARIEEIRKIARERPDEYDANKDIQAEQQRLLGILHNSKRGSRAA